MKQQDKGPLNELYASFRKELNIFNVENENLSDMHFFEKLSKIVANYKKKQSLIIELSMIDGEGDYIRNLKYAD